MKKNRAYTVGSLFAGVGGICEGFKQAGCKVVWANELDENSRRTYKFNHPDTPFTAKDDITDLAKEELKPVDILTAGFPCQPFSQAGSARGFDDERGRLFFHITRLLGELAPKAYFLENVKTLATHKGGETFETIRVAIAATNYSFIPFILRASEHTDIPQGRERIFIVGFRGESRFSYERPVADNSGLGNFAAPHSSRFRIPTPYDRPPKSVVDFLDPSTTDPTDYYTSPDNKIHQKVREEVTKPGVVYQYRRWFVRENKSDVCPTLTANMGLGGHNIPIVLDNGVPRRLSPKECFNLQGFRKDFKLPPDVSKVQLYRQCGNSVVVPLVKRIAVEIVRALNANGNS